MYRWRSTKYLTTCTQLIALIFVIGLISIKVTSKSIFQISDGLVIALAFLIQGPLLFVSASIGTTLIDLTSGSFVTIPATIIIHLLMVLICISFDTFTRKISNKKISFPINFLGLIFASSCVLLYIPYVAIYSPKSLVLVETFTDLIQFSANVAISFVLYLVIIKVNKNNNLWDDDQFYHFQKRHMKKQQIRNFCIIAHIDHGKSTLADRLLEITNSVPKFQMKDQFLDSLELERERGITIKLNAVQLKYTYKNKEYFLNLIDTPGHVDFSYEVSRSLAACEGALLVIDAAQGVQAQTLANLYLALENNLVIIPVINKIDLPTANIAKTKKQIFNILEETKQIPLISAKTGENISDVLKIIIEDIPAPLCVREKPLKALIFDSYFDKYRGVVLFVKVQQGILKTNVKILLMKTKSIFTVAQLGIKNPNESIKNELQAGEVGWISANIKNIKLINIGDTITDYNRPAKEILPGYKKIQPMVFCGFFPIDTKQYKNLRTALEKICLSDASIEYQMETSQALGHGFRCGFLGLLNMEIIQERLEREYNLKILATAPSVTYKIELTNKKIVYTSNPSDFPKTQSIKTIYEPVVKTNIIIPEEYVGAIMELCTIKRGTYIGLEIVDDSRRLLIYDIPLGEIIFNFFNRLKSITKGYGSFNYENMRYCPAKLVKMDILLNSKIVDALSIIIHKSQAFNKGKKLCEKLKEIIPRQNFEIPVQATINQKIIARETIKAWRKNVTAKLYGGDITRKRKLLDKQKKGKKRMKSVGLVSVPQEAFMSVLKND